MPRTSRRARQTKTRKIVVSLEIFRGIWHAKPHGLTLADDPRSGRRYAARFLCEADCGESSMSLEYRRRIGTRWRSELNSNSQWTFETHQEDLQERQIVRKRSISACTKCGRALLVCPHRVRKSIAQSSPS